MVGVKLYFM